MPTFEPSAAAPRPLDAGALARVARRLQAAPSPPWLHGEVARRMADRLPVIRLQPDTVVDWDAAVGASAAVLTRAYPHARRIAVVPGPVAGGPGPVSDADAPAAAWWSPRRWRTAALPSIAESALGDGVAQLVWANMSLQRALDPQQVMARWHRTLAVDGFLMFSTLGPGSLTDLRALYDAQGWPPPFAPFVDMHDLGDMLIEAGFADPVMDQELLTLTWASPEALLAELRLLGGNVDPRRHAGLRTPRWRQYLHDRLLDAAAADGRVALTFEIVYGHAFRPLPRPRVSARTEVPLDDLRAMARAARHRR